MKQLRSRVTYANVVATLALVFAVGGGAVASGALRPDNRIHGCLSEAGLITVVEPNTDCDASATPIAWNKTGPAGKRGLEGRKGDDGKRGRTGARGPTGLSGKAGVAGQTGQTGTRGSDGPTGPIGPDGKNGQNGETGPTGAKGDACLPTEPACVGPQGDKGSTGDKGEKGTTGDKGAKGDACLPAEPACVGPQGNRGEKGEKGETGEQGEIGEQGDACLATDVACVGPKGEPGTDGTNGAATPAGAVMSFNLEDCPDGWSEFTAARGRSIVGLTEGGELGGTAGTALTDLENRATGQHDHDVTDPGHTHVVPPHVHTTPAYQYYKGEYSYYSSYWDGYEVYLSRYSWPQYGSFLEAYIRYWPYTQPAQSTPASEAYDSGSTETGITVDPAGGVPGTNAPYIQLLSCQKD